DRQGVPRNIRDIYQPAKAPADGSPRRRPSDPRLPGKAPLHVARSNRTNRAAKTRPALAADASPKGPQPAETLTEKAYRVIEEQIVTLRLKPGEFVSEQMLSATYKFGRTPVREALQRLAREGLIAIFPRKGILVSDLNPRNQLLVLEVRREL